MGTTDFFKAAPVIGPWIGRIGQIQSILATPCTITPQIFVKAFFAGVPKLVWTLFKPDALDLTAERFQKGHRRRKRPILRAGGIIDGSVRAKPGLQTAVFTLGQLAQRIGWYFIIIDAATTHSLHWMSMAYQYSGCTTPEGIWCTATLGGSILSPSSEAFTASWSFAGGNAGPIISGPNITVPAGSTGSVFYTVSGKPPPNPPYLPPYGAVSGASLVQFPSGAILNDADGAMDGDGNSIFSGAYTPVEVLTNTTRTYQVHCKKTPGHLQLDESNRCQVVATPYGGLLADP